MATPAQEALIVQILAAATHFETLGILNFESCTVDDIKKTYRRLSLSLHPDKCPDPRAAEAFTRAEKASKILSDPGTLLRFREAAIRKRMRVDEQGGEDPKPRGPPSKMEADMTPGERAEAAKRKDMDEAYRRNLRVQREREEKKKREASRVEEDKRLNEQLTTASDNWRSHLKKKQQI